jgi:hypothetical protein
MIPSGAAIAAGIIAGYLLARYGLDLGLIRSRTVATGIVVFGGLAVVIRLEHAHGRRQVAVWALCALMLGIFSLALVVPFLREFYELAKPTGEMVAAWGLGTLIAVGGMLGGLRLLRV